MPENNAAVSLAPDSFVKGGLYDDVDVEVLHAHFKVWDYDHTDSGNGSGPEIPALKLVMRESSSGDEFMQFFSAGSLDNFVPTDDGDYEGRILTPTGTRSSLVESCSLAIFLNSLVEAGFPMDKLESGQIDVLNGLIMHIIRVPAPKRPGLKQAEGDREKTIVTCSQVIKYPWEKGKKGAKVSGGGKKSAATAVDAGDLDDRAREILDTILEKEGAIDLAKIKVPAIRAATAAKVPSNQRTAIVKLLSDEEWLTTNGYDVTEGAITKAE